MALPGTIDMHHYSNYPTFYNFSGTSNDTLFQVYCLNPPTDSCDFCPCPNLDVTGIGQQVSLYISSISFIIMLTYLPHELRFSSYTYLANIYSLMISASVALKRQQLTQNDALFTLIAISSPASLGHWILAFSFIVSKIWKRAIDPQKYGFSNSRELSVMIVLSLLSMLAWIVMICLVLIPSDLIQFNQPICSLIFPPDQAISLVWILPVTSHSVLLLLTFLFPWGAGSPHMPSSDVSRPPDVTQWIFNKLIADYPKFATPSTSRFLPFLVQLGGFPSLPFPMAVVLAFSTGVAGAV